MKFSIANKKIGNDCSTFFIADIAANHEGSLSRAKKLIRLAAKAGADAAKFQHFSANTIISNEAFKKLKSIKSHQTNWKNSVYEVYKKYSINLHWTLELIRECKKNSIIFLTSPYSLDYVDYFTKYIPAYKIGSGDITWLEIINKIAKKNKPVLLATGASDIKDVDNAVQEIIKYNKKLVLMQCNTNYTASDSNYKYINLNVISTFKKRYPNIILGLSDHTFGHETVLGAVSLGARVIEKHFTDNNDLEGPDHKFAMNPKSWREMVDSTRKLESSLGDGIKRIEKNEFSTVIVQRRAIYMGTDLKKNEKITRKNLEILRPCTKNSIPANKLKKIIGLKIKKNKKAGENLLLKDVY